MNKSIASVLFISIISAPAFGNDYEKEEHINLVFESNANHLTEAQVLSSQEMEQTQGELLPVLAVLGAGAISAWSYHGVHYYNHGTLGSSSGAAWAAGAGMLGGAHGGGLAASAGLSGASRAYVTGRGMMVGSSWNLANPGR